LHLKARLPEYMVPSAFIGIERMPLSPNGKLDRRALPAPDLAACAGRDYRPPEGTLETRLARLWCDLLRVERVGRQDNFFELGGHSLHATRLVLGIESELELRLPVAAVFQCPTLEALAELVESRRPITPGLHLPEGVEVEDGVI
jgi:arthrofactin-type cyclic lipopeptide synthetase B